MANKLHLSLKQELACGDILGFHYYKTWLEALLVNWSLLALMKFHCIKTINVRNIKEMYSKLSPVNSSIRDKKKKNIPRGL